MDTTMLQDRMDAIERKLDLVLEYIHQQQSQSSAVNDLVSDLSIIGKDAYDTAVEELDKRKLTLSADEVTDLLVTLVRNVDNIKTALNTLEMAVDLANDAGPIVNDAIKDFTGLVAEFDRKGYFRFMKEVVPILDNIIEGLTVQDMRDLADNVVLILHAVKDITQPKLLKSLDNAVTIYSSMGEGDYPSYSIWRVMREMNSPEMKKAIGFVVTFLKNVAAKQTELSNQNQSNHA